MKTTIDLPADLLRTMKLQAVREGRKYKDVAAEIFRRGLARPQPDAQPVLRRRVKLPLIKCGRPSPKLSAQEVAELLLTQEAEWSHEITRR